MLRIIAETFVNLYAVELPQLRGRRRVDGMEPPAIGLRNGGRADGVGVRSLISTQAGRDLPVLCLWVEETLVVAQRWSIARASTRVWQPRRLGGLFFVEVCRVFSDRARFERLLCGASSSPTRDGRRTRASPRFGETSTGASQPLWRLRSTRVVSRSPLRGGRSAHT